MEAAKLKRNSEKPRRVAKAAELKARDGLAVGTLAKASRFKRSGRVPERHGAETTRSKRDGKSEWTVVEPTNGSQRGETKSLLPYEGKNFWP